MPQEIERKFLVRGDFKAYACQSFRIVQGYLSSVPERTVTLCRCGASANKPYCDGTHVTVHFQDHLPLSTELEEKMK